MIVVERRNKIKEILLDKKSVKVQDLVKLFHVSEETIRRDLSQLEEDGIVQKNYGGAILVEEVQKPIDFILPVQQRKNQFLQEKYAIGKEAAKLVKNNQIVI